MGGAIAVGLFILWLALGMWVYFDATERGKPSIVWAGAVFFLGFLGLIPLILYLIFRDTGQRTQVPAGGGRRQYLYIVSFAGLGTLVVGLSLLAATTIVRVISENGIGDDGYRQAVAASLAAVLVGVVVWASHWFRAERRVGEVPDDQEFRATFYLHRAYLYTVFGLSWIIVFIGSFWLLGGGLADLLGAEDVDVEGWLPALGPVLIALLVVAFHFLGSFETPRYQQLLARFEATPPPPAIGPGGGEAPLAAVAAASSPALAAPPPPPAERRHCTRCGAPAGPEDLFCGACGSALRSGAGG